MVARELPLPDCNLYQIPPFCETVPLSRFIPKKVRAQFLSHKSSVLLNSRVIVLDVFFVENESFRANILVFPLLPTFKESNMENSMGFLARGYLNL